MCSNGARVSSSHGPLSLSLARARLHGDLSSHLHCDATRDHRLLHTHAHAHAHRYKSLYLEGLGPATVDEHTAARCRALFRRYENREPYKLIFGRGLAGSEVSQKPKEIEAAVRRTIAHLGHPADCLDIRVGAMHYGKKESNPLISMRFFDKETDIDDDARAVDHGVLRFDVNVPEKFCLRSLRIYYKRGWKREADRPEYQKVKASLKTLLALVPPARPGESHTSPLAFSDKK